MINDAKLVERMARRIVSSELRSYDQLSRQSKIRYEHSLQKPEPTPLDAGVYQCAHGVWLYTQCAKCGRGPDEALVYVRVMQTRLEELVAILDGK
jgi:hypothetical protein